MLTWAQVVHRTHATLLHQPQPEAPGACRPSAFPVLIFLLLLLVLLLRWRDDKAVQGRSQRQGVCRQPGAHSAQLLLPKLSLRLLLLLCQCHGFGAVPSHERVSVACGGQQQAAVQYQARGQRAGSAQHEVRLRGGVRWCGRFRAGCWRLLYEVGAKDGLTYFLHVEAACGQVRAASQQWSYANLTCTKDGKGQTAGGTWATTCHSMGHERPGVPTFGMHHASGAMHTSRRGWLPPSTSPADPATCPCRCCCPAPAAGSTSTSMLHESTTSSAQQYRRKASCGGVCRKKAAPAVRSSCVAAQRRGCTGAPAESICIPSSSSSCCCCWSSCADSRCLNALKLSCSREATFDASQMVTLFVTCSTRGVFLFYLPYPT